MESSGKWETINLDCLRMLTCVPGKLLCFASKCTKIGSECHDCL